MATSSPTASSLMTSLTSTNASTKTPTTIPNNGTNYNSTTDGMGAGSQFPNTAEVAISVVISIIVVVVIAAALFLIFKKFGKQTPCCKQTRRRRSSTSSSRQVLADEMACEDVTSSHRPNEKLKQATDEMFTIEDYEEGEEGDGRGDREEYFYDEVFGRSEFEDETTQNSVRQLYSNHEDGEMLDLDFETLGISADQFSPEHYRNERAPRV